MKKAAFEQHVTEQVHPLAQFQTLHRERNETIRRIHHLVHCCNRFSIFAITCSRSGRNSNAIRLYVMSCLTLWISIASNINPRTVERACVKCKKGDSFSRESVASCGGCCFDDYFKFFSTILFMIDQHSLLWAFANGEQWIKRQQRLLHGNLDWDIYRGRAINCFCQCCAHNTWDEVCYEGHDGSDPQWRSKGSDYRRPTVYVCEDCFRTADRGNRWIHHPGRPCWDGGHAVKMCLRALRKVCDWWMCGKERYLYPKQIAFLMLEYWCDFSVFLFLQPSLTEEHFWHRLVPSIYGNKPSKSRKRRERRKKLKLN